MKQILLLHPDNLLVLCGERNTRRDKKNKNKEGEGREDVEREEEMAGQNKDSSD